MVTPIIARRADCTTHGGRQHPTSTVSNSDAAFAEPSAAQKCGSAVSRCSAREAALEPAEADEQQADAERQLAGELDRRRGGEAA